MVRTEKKCETKLIICQSEQTGYLRCFDTSFETQNENVTQVKRAKDAEWPVRNNSKRKKKEKEKKNNI